MSLRSRTMQPRDVRECAEIIVAHPAIGARYRHSIKDLSQAWLRLLDCEAKTALVLEELNGSKATICFVGVSIFASDDFVREIKTPPLFWVGPELAQRLIREVWPSFFDWLTSQLFHLRDRQAKMTALRLRCRGEGDTRDRLSGNGGLATTVSKKKTAWPGVHPVQPHLSALLEAPFPGIPAECLGCKDSPATR